MITRHILLYLIKHPNAKDTVQGIRQWWLKGDVAADNTTLREHLGTLVTKGWLTRRQTSFGQPLYGLNPDALEDIRAFVRYGSNDTKRE